MSENQADEQAFLERVVDTYVTSDSSQDRAIKEMAVRTFKPFLDKKMRALEFGCCDGYMTSLLAPLVGTLDVVDGSETWLSRAKSRNIANARFILSLFEEIKLEEKYDAIFATYVLEHVRDPCHFLKTAHSLLKPDGILMLVVPNARSLSRQLARHMGILNDLFDLTENDIRHGHRRVYDRVSLDRELSSAGFVHIARGGLMLKFLADFQMNELIDSGVLSDAQLDALYSLGLEYPDFCGSLFSLAKQA